ncbi:hypothetical protein VNO78_32857 [Psophocarpus tetragonolobus]|uniref:Uncharacterized protein n=1 Tax=Psophocarpus tetragonolobus TaxID=3891 RepID=A0AAN9P1C5_PSOTE
MRRTWSCPHNYRHKCHVNGGKSNSITTRRTDAVNHEYLTPPLIAASFHAFFTEWHKWGPKSEKASFYFFFLSDSSLSFASSGSAPPPSALRPPPSALRSTSSGDLLRSFVPPLVSFVSVAPFLYFLCRFPNS